ncbi:hypothetical protein ABT324_24105 [Saccharopolyspora sp. NPDC000359]|uniref:hypothetical protein n=1 Tax=Saccharopolyspora sp. NPDC000359 TaxID=3154251 RepID=UPI003322E10A
MSRNTWDRHSIAVVSGESGDTLQFAVESIGGHRTITITREGAGDPFELTPSAALACIGALAKALDVATAN